MHAMFPISCNVFSPVCCHPNHKLCGGINQSGDVVQAVAILSMPGLEPTSGDAVDACAACDLPDLEATAALGLVVHNHVAVAAGSPTTSTTSDQASNPAVQVCHVQAAIHCSVQSDAHHPRGHGHRITIVCFSQLTC